jgi:hypothetical protein
METKDYVYCALVALTAAVFYWHGYLAARCRARKSFAAIFNDRRSVRELPACESDENEVMSHRAMRPGRARRSARIRAVFGIN